LCKYNTLKRRNALGGSSKKMKGFFELKIGSMTMDEYGRIFLNLLKYFDFIKDEHVKIQRFLSGFSSIFSDKIQYDDSKTLDEEIRRSKCLYDQHKGRPTFQKAWEDKNKGNMEYRKKGKNHQSSRIILRGNQLKMNPECWKHWEKGYENNPLNVVIVREITCI
jgi:hypothetical protein